MPINFPDSRQDVISRIKTDVQAQLPQSNPFLRNSYLNALIVGYGGRVFEVYRQMQQLLKEMFPDTATGDFLKRWGFYINLFIKAPAFSQGLLAQTGIVGSFIPTGTQYQSEAGNTYVSTENATITVNLNVIDSLSASGNVASAETVDIHELASGMLVTIVGADQPQYNGIFQIQTTSLNKFTYDIVGSPPAATGVITASINSVSVPVKSNLPGADQNVANGGSCTLTTPLIGADGTVFVEFEGLSGGTDTESDAEFRARVIDKYQNPNTPFNEQEIINKAREVAGVTRVFVEQPDTTTGDYVITSLTRVGNVATAVMAVPHNLISGMFVGISGAIQLDYNIATAVVLVVDPTTFIYLVQNTPTTPATGTIFSHISAVQPGQVRVFFTRDNDAHIIPNTLEVSMVKDELLKIKPAHTAAQDLIVLAPIAIVTDFNFSSITPDTLTMRQAIVANIDAFFREATSVGQTVVKKAYDSAIFNTIDPDTGDILQNYILTTPLSDIVVTSGKLATFGTSNLVA